MTQNFAKFAEMIAKHVMNDEVWSQTVYSPSDIKKFTVIKVDNKRNWIMVGDPRTYLVTIRPDEGKISANGINQNIVEVIFANAVEKSAKICGIKLKKVPSHFSVIWEIL